MKSGLNGLIRLHRWQLEEQRRKLGQLEAMRAEFERRAKDLELEIANEQKRVKNTEASFAYGAYAQAAIARRETLAQSIEGMELELVKARDQVAEAFREVKKFEIAQDRQIKRAQLAAGRKEQQTLDELSLDIYRRRKAR